MSYARQCAYSHVGGAPGRHQVEEREGVDDEAQLLVRQQGEEQHEAQRGQQDGPRPGVTQPQGNQGQGAAQRPGQGGVEVPQEGRGLLRGVKERAGVQWGQRTGRLCSIVILK